MSAVSGEHEEDEDGSKKDGVGVPQLIVDTVNPTESQAEQTLAKGILPTVEEVLDGLGLGPNGPPIPPPATFAVVPYPVRRRPPLGIDPPSHYVFVASGPDDRNAPQEDKTKEAEPEVEKTPEKPPVGTKTRRPSCCLSSYFLIHFTLYLLTSLRIFSTSAHCSLFVLLSY